MERWSQLDSWQLLRLLQLSDSGFPTGAYAFSTGVEALHARGLLTSSADLESLIVSQLQETLSGVDLPACFHSHRFAAAADLIELAHLDHVVSALSSIGAFRNASVRVGKRFLASVLPLVESALLDEIQSGIREGHLAGHYPVVFGAVMQGAGLDSMTTALAFGAIFVTGQVAAGVRLGILGQTAAQAIITRSQPELVRAVDQARMLPVAEMGGFSPLVEFAGLLQPFLSSRLFGS